MNRMETLAALQDGWDGPRSVSPRAEALDNYRSLVNAVGVRIGPEIAPMATADGGIRMEWERGETTYIAELQPDGGMYLCSLGADANDDWDREFAVANVRLLARFVEDGIVVVGF